MNYTHILWDWNGTLLDDADYCIAAINKSLVKRGLPALDKKRYAEIFRFPVADYYRDLGFDFTKESYADLAAEFTAEYAANKDELRLFRDAREVLAVFAGKKIEQFILSASERNVLTDALDRYGIRGYFSRILAADDYYASGKIEIGKAFFEENRPEGKFLLVGDSEHDYETARAVGADCVLCCRGHGSKENLLKLGVPVIDDLCGLYPYVLGAVSKKKRAPDAAHNADADEKLSYDLMESEENEARNILAYKAFYDDIKNTRKTEDW
jgi:phosphoglycolate phosphatase